MLYEGKHEDGCENEYCRIYSIGADKTSVPLTLATLYELSRSWSTLFRCSQFYPVVEVDQYLERAVAGQLLSKQTRTTAHYILYKVFPFSLR